MSDTVAAVLAWISWTLVAGFVIEAVAFAGVLIWARLANEGAFEVDLGDAPEKEPAP